MENKPEVLTNARQGSLPNNRKRKDKRTSDDVKSASETEPEDANSKQDINRSQHTILNVPSYAQTTGTEPDDSDVTALEKSVSVEDCYRQVFVVSYLCLFFSMLLAGFTGSSAAAGDGVLARQVAQLWQRNRAKIALFSINVQLCLQNYKIEFFEHCLFCTPVASLTCTDLPDY